jgi:hypothetical protein
MTIALSGVVSAISDGFGSARGVTINGASTMSFGCTVRQWGAVRAGRGIWGIVLLGAIVGGAWVTHAADDASATGLQGILPAGVPADLSAAIASLPDNWQEWGNGLTADLAGLYEKEGLNVEGQRKAIGALDARLKTVRASLADPRYKAIMNQLVSLQGGLKRRLDVAKAALDTLELGPEIQAARLEASRREVGRTAAVLDAYLNSVRGGSGWVKYLQVGDVRQQIGADDSKSVITLAGVQSRLKGKATLADARTRDFMGRPEFSAYEQAVDNYLRIAGAAAPSANSPELRKGLADLLGSLEGYENFHTNATAASVRKSFEAVRGMAPDGGDRLAQALRTNYFNYNLRVVATEAFLNRLVKQRRQEQGQVRDYILGANVSGAQSTVTEVSLDLVPSNNVAQFDITANGAVSSNTVGVTEQANIYTQGNHYFTAQKRVLFNGDKFWTQPARIGVSANNTTLDAETSFSGGLFGGIADRIAMRKAQEKRGESEAIAAGRVQDNVLPKFNTEVDKEFGASGTANNEFGQKIAALRELRLYPDAKTWSTTDTELHVSSRLMSANELGGSDPHPALIVGRGVTVLVHDSLMNNSTDRLDLQGQALTDEQLKGRIEHNLTVLLGREFKFKNDKPVDPDEASKQLVFDAADPIRFQSTDGTLNVTLRAGLRQEGKEDIPTQVITIPLRFSVDTKNVVIEPGAVSVSPIEKAENAAQQLARAGVIKKKIEAAFPRREIDRVATVERGSTKVNVAVTRIKALDGWLSITFE